MRNGYTVSVKYSPIVPLSILIAVVGSTLSGCESRATSEHIRQEDGASGDALAADRVLEIARQAVAANDSWVDRAELETPTKQPDGSWSVMVWRLPKTPGGHRLVIIDAKGEVTDYMRGA